MRLIAKAPLLALSGLILFALPEQKVEAQEKFTLRFNHVLGPKEPYHAGFLKWAERVEKRTNGRLKIEVFHSAQLGVEEDIIEQIRQGANIGQNTDSARLGNYIRGIAVMNGPYFAESLEDVTKLTKAPTVQKWDQELADKHGLRINRFARRKIFAVSASVRHQHQSGRSPCARLERHLSRWRSARCILAYNRRRSTGSSSSTIIFRGRASMKC
jgi:TRAP-type C4-dicarboxylate transport system substrate-binding protein